MSVLQPFPRHISYGHKAMYLGPAALMGHTKSSVIDVACGDGYGYHTLVSHNAIASYWGIDNTPTEIEKGRQLLVSPKHTMVCGDWLTYPEADLVPADFVFCIEVLEHVPAELRRAFVEKCVRFAKRNIFFSTPPADRNDHGRLTIPECRDLLLSVGLGVVVVDVQWTTLYVCSLPPKQTAPVQSRVKSALGTYRNAHAGKSAVLFLSGPTLAQYVEPEPDLITCGVNTTIFHRSELDYCFLQDAGYASHANSYVNRKADYDAFKPRIAKFYGTTLCPMLRDVVNTIPYEFTHGPIININGARIEDPKVPADFSADLSTKLPAAAGSIAFPALQFLLWTGIKRLYIVGADITDGRRIGEEKASQNYVRQNHLQRWQEFEQWVTVAYPDVEIVPLNPIGLAGMFSLRVKDKVVAQPAAKLAVAGQGRFRLHCLAPPHAITAPGFSHCGFTNKLRHFCKFMTEAGHVVWHYGHENSEVVCTEHVTVSDDSTIAAYADWKNTSYNGQLDDECNKAFTVNAIREIKKRFQPRDFILCFYGVGNKSVADAFPNAIIVEPGIGSFKTFAPFRVFESYALMHHTYGRENTKPKFYDVVIPAFLDPSEFRYSEKKEDWLLFLGRVQPIKGVTVAIDIAKRAGRKLKIAGQGTLKDVPSHVEMLGYADPVMKADLLSRATALVQPSLYMEPFGNNAIEAAVSGTPTICVDWGGFTENVIHGATGWRCRTMSQFDWAVAFIDKIVPAVCRQWALGNYTVEQARLRYEEYLKDVWGVFFGCDFNGSDKARADVVGPRRFVR